MPGADLRYGDPRAAADPGGAGRVPRTPVECAPIRSALICGGFVQALALLSTTLKAAGSTAVAMENPCMNAYRTVTAPPGCRCGSSTSTTTAPIQPVGQLGVSRRAGWRDVAAVLLTPAHQYPTGTTLAPDRRAAFVEWARAQRPDRDRGRLRRRAPLRPPTGGALQGMDAERVATSGRRARAWRPVSASGGWSSPTAWWSPCPQRRSSPTGSRASSSRPHWLS